MRRERGLTACYESGRPGDKNRGNENPSHCFSPRADYRCRHPRAVGPRSQTTIGTGFEDGMMAKSPRTICRGANRRALPCAWGGEGLTFPERTDLQVFGGG